LGKNLKRFVTAVLACLLAQLFAGDALARTGAPMQRSTEEENALVHAAEQNPRDARMAAAAGEFYLHQERWQKSVRWLSKAYALSDGNQQIGYDLADARIENGDLNEAQRQLQEMLAKADTARVHSLLGALHERGSEFPAAAQEYHRAAEIEPSESNIFDLANFLLQHKQYVGYLLESVKFFRYGASKFPDSPKMLVGLGVALYASQEYDEAVKVLCAAVDLAPNDQRPVTFLGMARKVSPELAEQVDHRLQDFTKRYPENPAANYEYAMSLWDRGGGEQGKSLPEIETYLQRAIKKAPQWYEPHYQLAIVYESEKRYPDAIREMRRTTVLEPTFKPAHFRLAVLYKHIGDRVHAAQESDRAKQLDNEQIKREALQDAPK
jgi:tetratricopeptide (TPR) repeat protein